MLTPAIYLRLYPLFQCVKSLYFLQMEVACALTVDVEDVHKVHQALAVKTVQFFGKLVQERALSTATLSLHNQELPALIFHKIDTFIHQRRRVYAVVL